VEAAQVTGSLAGASLGRARSAVSYRSQYPLSNEPNTLGVWHHHSAFTAGQAVAIENVIGPIGICGFLRIGHGPHFAPYANSLIARGPLMGHVMSFMARVRSSMSHRGRALFAGQGVAREPIEREPADERMRFIRATVWLMVLPHTGVALSPTCPTRNRHRSRPRA